MGTINLLPSFDDLQKVPFININTTKVSREHHPDFDGQSMLLDREKEVAILEDIYRLISGKSSSQDTLWNSFSEDIKWGKIYSYMQNRENLTQLRENMGGRVGEIGYFSLPRDEELIINIVKRRISIKRIPISIEELISETENGGLYEKIETEETTEEQLHREAIIQDMEHMKKNKFRTVKGKMVTPKSVPNPDIVNDYWGSDVGKNMKGTYINERLAILFDPETQVGGTYLKVEKLSDGKHALALYQGGILVLASYVSVGTFKNRTPYSNKVLNDKEPIVDRYHVSSEYPEEDPGASMPYALHVGGAIWFHGSGSTIDGKPHSHGCIRVPLFYMKKLFDTIQTVETYTLEFGDIYEGQEKPVSEIEKPIKKPKKRVAKKVIPKKIIPVPHLEEESGGLY